MSYFDLVLIIIAVMVMLLGFVKLAQRWRPGRGERAGQNAEGRGFLFLLGYLLLHRKILQNRASGLAHLFIFWGFFIPLIIVLIAQFRLVWTPLPARILSLALDLVGMLAVAGIVLLLGRHFTSKNPHKKASALHLWLLLAIFLSGFMAEGARLSITGPPISENWLASPVGAAVSVIMPASPLMQALLIRTHFLLVLIFIALLPFTLMRHVVTAALNVYFAKQQPRGTIGLMPLKGDSFGAGRIEDLNWKQRLDVDACVNCSRCDVHCPAHQSRQPLSPQGVIRGLAKGLDTASGRSPQSEAETVPLVDAQGVINGADIWACTTCLNCVEQCPVFIHQLDKIIDLRRHAVLTEGRFPKAYKTLFKKLETFGDCLGQGPLLREDWAPSSAVKRAYRQNAVDTLFWVGCIPALYDERSRRRALTAAGLLDKIGVSFAILGKQERCCGDPARRLGNEYLFQTLARQNIARFQQYGIKKIVTLCPHCYNVFKHEYPQLGGHFTVIHFVELIEDALSEGKIRLQSRQRGTFTYHDPCYLGRYNDMYRPPREIAKRVLAADMVEMERSQNTSFCCGAGGGSFWRSEVAGQRMEAQRVQEALATHGDGVITACPFCEIMFASALQQQGREHQFQVLDIVELVAPAT